MEESYSIFSRVENTMIVDQMSQVDDNGQTPLYYAIRSVRMETVEFLIKESGANVNHEDLRHETPMIIAKRTAKKQLINLLLLYGAKAPEVLRKNNQHNV